MFEKVIAEIRNMYNPTKEICGIISDNLEMYPIENVASASNDFVFDRGDYFSAISEIASNGKKVLCVYHTHLGNDARPSANDILAIKRLKLNYLIVTQSDYSYTEYANV